MELCIFFRTDEMYTLRDAFSFNIKDVTQSHVEVSRCKVTGGGTGYASKM